MYFIKMHLLHQENIITRKKKHSYKYVYYPYIA